MSVEALIVTTSKYVLCIDARSHTVKVLDAFRGIYYGACVDADTGRLYIGTRNGHRGPADPGARPGERGSVLVFDPDLLLVDDIRPTVLLRDLHAMTLADGVLYVVCSFDNYVATYDLVAATWQVWYPHPDPSKRDHDFHHFNFVFSSEDRLFVVAHNRGPSQVLSFDRATRDLLECSDIGREAHDAWIEDGHLCVLSSGESLVRSARGVLLRTNAYPRGYCRVGDRRFVGLSARSVPTDRLDEDGVVRVFSSDWELLEDIGLRGVGMVNQIVPIDLPEAVFDALPVLASRQLTPFPAERFDPSVYELSEPQSVVHRYADEWHAIEPNGCWTAAREARMRLFPRPGDRTLTIVFSTVRPAHTHVCIAGVRIGERTGLDAGLQEATYDLPSRLDGEQILTIGTDALSRVPGDPRALGVFVHQVRLK